MRGFIANTDHNWYTFLSEQADLEEVNFWKPLGSTSFRALQPGEPLLFKLKKAHGHAVVGFGFFLTYRALQVRDAWTFFGAANGVRSLTEMWERIGHYMARSNKGEPTSHHEIGCILLISPVFFPPALWVDAPRDWKDQIVSGKGYDLTAGEGKRIWQDCMAAASSLSLREAQHDNLILLSSPKPRTREVVARARLGQGTFRLAVTDSYQQCAVTREHSLPALDAAHIKPFTHDGPHLVSNGLLLRADIHRLFDRGYVTVTPDHRFKVSSALDEEFNNGKVYYQLDDKKIVLPKEASSQPGQEFLAFHHEEVFRGA